MISSLTGTITCTKELCAIINLHGIGLEVHIPHATTLLLESTITLHTFLSWSQENGPSLFGFINEHERALFIHLISTPGIGPKMAINILDHLDPATLINAINNEETKVLSSISGIGPKKAQHMIMHLKDKIKSFIATYPELSTTQSSFWNDIQQALTTLGYSKQEISTVHHHLKGYQENQSFDQLLRAALGYLAKRT